MCGSLSTVLGAIKTCDLALESADQLHVPVTKSWRLNERMYGALTGLDKKETVKKHGADQVQIWRRSFDIPPPDIEESSEFNPAKDEEIDDEIYEKDKRKRENQRVFDCLSLCFTVFHRVYVALALERRRSTPP